MVALKYHKNVGNYNTEKIRCILLKTVQCTKSNNQSQLTFIQFRLRFTFLYHNDTKIEMLKKRINIKASFLSII